MHMTEHGNSQDREKLVQCWLINPQGEGRYRFLELYTFRLWEYLVTTKHGMRVESPTMRLWVPNEVYRYYEDLYSHAGNVASIDRVTIERYDPHYGFSHPIHRYTLAEDTEALVEHLEGHLSEQGIESGDWDLTVLPGYGIEPDVDELVEPVALGLT